MTVPPNQAQIVATIHTADEALQSYIASMGAALGKQFHALWQELAWLYSKWGEYVELFGTKAERIDLMNRAAPRFFRIVQDSLWEDTLLAIARLTDPPKSVGKENLTIQTLPALVADQKVSVEVRRFIDRSVAASDFCRDWRHRRIAHRDLKLAIELGTTPLKHASRLNVKNALEAIANTLNHVSVHYGHPQTMFDMGAGGSNGAVTLLYVLDDGLKADTARRERIRSLKYSAEDLKPGNL